MLIVSLLGIQICIGVAAIYLANSDPTVAIIPNYYEAATNWDATRRARQQYFQNGWNLETEVSAISNTNRTVTLSIHGPGGIAIEELRIRAKAFHHAHGDKIDTFAFEECGSGVYQGSTKLTQAGLWQLELRFEGDSGIAETVCQITVQ